MPCASWARPAPARRRSRCSLRDEFPVEIVSVDSALVYRGMDIGTSKPSCGRACRRAASPDRHLRSRRSRTPRVGSGVTRWPASTRSGPVAACRLLVGGTMLYFRALTHGLAPLPEADPARARRHRRPGARIWAGPRCMRNSRRSTRVAAARIRPFDAQRIQRALEVIELTGGRLSELQKLAEPAPLRLARFALLPLSRAQLYERINARFDAMLAAGFLQEVRDLRARGDLEPDLPSLRAVGYRQLWQHLEGAVDLRSCGRCRAPGHPQPGQAPADVAAGGSGHNLGAIACRTGTCPYIRRSEEFLRKIGRRRPCDKLPAFLLGPRESSRGPFQGRFCAGTNGYDKKRRHTTWPKASPFRIPS